MYLLERTKSEFLIGTEGKVRSPTVKNVQHLKEGEVWRVADVSKGCLEQRHSHRRTARGEQVGGRE